MKVTIYTAAELRAACAMTRPGDLIQLPPLTLAMDNAPLMLPNGVTIRGEGESSTTVNAVYANSQGTTLPANNPANVCCAWELGYGTIVEGLTLNQLATITDATTGQPVASQQSETIGFSAGPAGMAGKASALLKHVTVNGLTWPVYSWSAAGNHIQIEDCTIAGGRTLVANCNSSSTGISAGTIDCFRTHFNGNSLLSTYQGGFGEFLQTIVSRGGLVRVFDSDATLTGDPTILVVQNNWTGNSPTDGSILFRNFTSTIVPNGAKAWADFNSASGSTSWIGCAGSGAGGALVVSNIPIVERP